MLPRAPHKRARTRRLAEYKILLRKRQRSCGIATDREPEFRSMIGERISVTREQLLIPDFRFATPGLRLFCLAGVGQDSSELRCVVGIVGREREGPKAGDGRGFLAQGSIEFG